MNCNLDKDVRPCEFKDKDQDISRCVGLVNTLSVDSESPAQVWLLKFRRGTLWDGVPMRRAVMKIWPNLPGRKYDDRLAGLDYEYKVQELITRSTHSPYFVKLYSGARDYSRRDVRQLLTIGDQGGFYQKGRAVERVDAKTTMANFDNNVWKLLNGEKAGDVRAKPKAAKPKEAKPKEAKPKEAKPKEAKPKEAKPKEAEATPDWVRQLTYQWSLVEFVEAPTYFSAIMNMTGNQPFKVLFQVIYACHLMSELKLVHNDLHLGNIFVTENKSSKTSTYKVESKNYKFECDHQPKIFDFDRAYCSELGPNRTLDNEFARQYSQTNTFNPKRDALKVLMGFQPFFANSVDVNNALARVVASTDVGKRIWFDFIDTRKNPQNQLLVYNGKPFEYWDYINPTATMLSVIYREFIEKKI